MASTLGVLNPLTYRGYVYDHETGLYYLQSRYYNPEWGRFINADDATILTEDTESLLHFNLYAYCWNNPINMSDPNGETPANVIGAIIGGVLGAVGGVILGKWLADKISFKTNFARNLFIGTVGALVGVGSAAIGYALGPYLKSAWCSIKNGLINLLKKSYTSIADISPSRMSNKINVAKHAWNRVLKNVTDDNITKIIHKAIKYGKWELGGDGSVYINYYIGNEKVRMSGKIIDGIFRISDAWVITK